MILINEIEKKSLLTIDSCAVIIKLLFPFAPHIAQELWQKLGHKTLLDYESWPEWDEKLAQEETFDLIVQINGKTRGIITAPRGIAQLEAEKLALTNEKITKWITPDKIKNTIFVKDRLINFII